MTDIEADGVGSGECAIQFQDYSEGIVVSMLILEFQATGDGQIELHVYGDANADTSVQVKDLDIEAAEGVGSGECAIQFQDYSEGIVSMLILEFQATGPRLGLVLCNRKRAMARLFMFTVRYDRALEAGMVSGFQANAIQFQDYSEAIVVSMLILEFQATGPR
ncbi:Glutamate Receptor 4 [Manis pentadactyla]|nr:Glutamate Receptor 4 [Manis pentadactyla]